MNKITIITNLKIAQLTENWLRKSLKILVLLGAGLGLQLIGCAAPFSDYQTAHLAGKGEVEITPSYSTVGISGEHVQDQVGAQLGLGLSNDLDVRARFVRLWMDGLDTDYIDVFGFGPKIPLHQDRAALYIPFGFAFGGGIKSSETWEAHPTLITTHVVDENTEINFSMKIMVSLKDDGAGTRFAANLGLGIGPDVMSYVVRPEAGVMFYTSGGDPFYHFGLGLSVSTTKSRRSDSARYR